MDIEKQLDKHLKRLNDTIQDLIAQSPEFSDLRKLLRDEDVELAIYVVPLMGQEEHAEEPAVDLKLNDFDKRFLKESGIQF
jgi:hypothetical protein